MSQHLHWLERKIKAPLQTEECSPMQNKSSVAATQFTLRKVEEFV